MTPDTSCNDRTLELFADTRRRFTLYFLLSNEYTDTESLSVQVAAWETDESIAEVSPERQRSVKIALHHVHLPKLAARDVIEFDHRSGDVVVADGFERLRPFVEEFRESEEALDADCPDRRVVRP